MPQSTVELKQRVDQISAIFKSILDDNTVWTNLGQAKQQQLVTGINKSYGQAMSFFHEYTTTRGAENKGRAITTQTHADVTVGQADQIFAKSSECKSVTKPEKGAVNKIIGEAIEQLGGQTGHNPRAGDVRIVDVKIDGTYNPWPLPGGAYGTNRGSALLANIQNQAEAELIAIINANKAGANAVRTWLFGEDYGKGLVTGTGRLRDVTTTVPNPISPQFSAPTKQKLNPNSTRPVYATAGGQIHKIRCLTIKIRYEDPYILLDVMPINQVSSLAEIVIQTYKKTDGSLITETAKVKKVIYDITDINNIQAQIVRA
ncbi:hypothetical protein [Alloacidobacterium sp.]|uniref:hypothetical protein n=1 Tax=Alloacidobacterium sp. TaxID=2951999 RepID=UPI002D6382F9|nr:hypothetical protein [Alloacidobacterium sp.]HYK36324.1 hypothetical protein [Alloacidobacterium sp.]